MNEPEFLRSAFRDYYSSVTVQEPPAIEQREFGVGDFGKKISGRHLAFGSYAELNRFLREKTPFFVSSSVAYFQKPAGRPMDAKGFLGADLVYEFDSDDIKTDCKSDHDSWQCPNCNASGKGNLGACTNCGAGVKVDQWVCPECLTAVKKQALELLDVLQNDLGISNGLSLNFSGSKGFHVHVRSESVRSLSQAGRMELLDFLTAYGLHWESLGFIEEKNMLHAKPLSDSRGWARRLVSGVIAMVKHSNADELALAGSVSVKTAEKVLEQKERVIEKIKSGLFPVVSAKSSAFWKNVLSYVLDDLRLNIDRQTSVDRYKIVRLPNTIHGSTGLLASPILPDHLRDFDGLTQSVVLPEKPVLLQINRVPRFFVGQKWWGPFENQTLELPLYCAAFLLSRQSAILARLTIQS